MTTPYIELQQLSQNSGFIELYMLDCTALGGTTYYFTNNISPTGGPLYFGGITYTPLAIATSGWDFTSTGAPPKPTLTVSNVQKNLLNAVVSMGDIVGAKLTRIRTFEKFLDAGTYVRRNLINWSEDLRNTADAGATRYWSQYLDSDTAVTHGHAAPNGTNTASKLYASTTGLQQRQIQQSVTTIAANSSATHSVYAKAGEARYMKLYIATSTSPVSYPYVVFDLLTGQVEWNAPSGGFTLTSSITDASNGWYRCTVTLADVGTGGSNVTAIIQITNNNSGSVNYTPASAGDGFYLWGDQLEVGTVATEYQYTTTSHQPYADPTKYLGPDVYIVEQKVAHNKNVISWQLTSILDRMGMKLPRRQVLKDKGFPGVSRSRVR